MSDSAEIVLTFSVLTSQADQFMYVWLCRDFDFHTEQCSAENRPAFRRFQTDLLCRARSNIFIRDVNLQNTLFSKLDIKFSFYAWSKSNQHRWGFVWNHPSSIDLLSEEDICLIEHQPGQCFENKFEEKGLKCFPFFPIQSNRLDWKPFSRFVKIDTLFVSLGLFL